MFGWSYSCYQCYFACLISTFNSFQRKPQQLNSLFFFFWRLSSHFTQWPETLVSHKWRILVLTCVCLCASVFYRVITPRISPALNPVVLVVPWTSLPCCTSQTFPTESPSPGGTLARSESRTHAHGATGRERTPTSITGHTPVTLSPQGQFLFFFSFPSIKEKKENLSSSFWQIPQHMGASWDMHLFECVCVCVSWVPVITHDKTEKGGKALEDLRVELLKSAPRLSSPQLWSR